MKKKMKKLSLNRETLRNLSKPEMSAVAGGICTGAPCGYATVSRTEAISNCTNECCTNECTVETCYCETYTC